MNHGEYKEYEADRLGMISSDCRLFSFLSENVAASSCERITIVQ